MEANIPHTKDDIEPLHHKIGDGSPWIYPWGGSRRVPLSVEFLSVL